MAFEGFVVTKILHVFFAVAWIGAMVYLQVILMPLMNRADPQTRQKVLEKVAPWNIKYGNWVGGFTVLTGISLISMNPYGIGWGDLTRTYWGQLVLFSLIGALAILYLLNVAVRPSFRKVQELMAEADPEEDPPPGAVLLQKRIAFTTRLMLVIGLVVVAAMVTAGSAGLLSA